MQTINHCRPKSPNPDDEIPYWTSADAAIVLEQAKERAARQAYAEMLVDAEFPPGTVLSLLA